MVLRQALLDQVLLAAAVVEAVHSMRLAAQEAQAAVGPEPTLGAVARLVVQTQEVAAAAVPVPLVLTTAGRVL